MSSIRQDRYYNGQTLRVTIFFLIVFALTLTAAHLLSVSRRSQPISTGPVLLNFLEIQFQLPYTWEKISNVQSLPQLPASSILNDPQRTSRFLQFNRWTATGIITPEHMLQLCLGKMFDLATLNAMTNTDLEFFQTGRFQGAQFTGYSQQSSEPHRYQHIVIILSVDNNIYWSLYLNDIINANSKTNIQIQNNRALAAELRNSIKMKN